MNKDIGLTHIALTSKNIDASIQFYGEYANMKVVHERGIEPGSTRVVWLSDQTRPFVIVLMESNQPAPPLGSFAHLGVGCESRERLDKLCDRARKANILVREPVDTGYPAGYWAFIKDPDGYNLELSYGQEVGLTVANA
ncbi:VOC family protein [Endozoicomonas euniceicola]|uniref:VOC family protein n=1 Tax=Endozoicomonas euniceicola TaxID=1234143 RepID=A0ABY6GQ14_9GAMM|nr:VOC family protein [Endozoicomonas euniceicola]UYM14845.1 VOC family protein [Endozoicomonas euniceicola]